MNLITGDRCTQPFTTPPPKAKLDSLHPNHNNFRRLRYGGALASVRASSNGLNTICCIPLLPAFLAGPSALAVPAGKTPQARLFAL